MYLVREVMYCRPGRVRAMITIFSQVQTLMRAKGYARSVRLMTDMSGERYWTVIAEQEVASIEEYLATTRKTMSDPEVSILMKGYHDIVESGRREIYQLEA